MFRCFTLLTAAALLTSIVAAGPLDDFAAARQENGIIGTTSYEGLMSLDKETVVEVSGKVSGSMTSQDGTATLIVKIGKSSFVVDAPSVPQWVAVGASDGRFIVNAKPGQNGGSPSLTLIVSITEQDAVNLEKRLQDEADYRKQVELQQKAEEQQKIDESHKLPSLTFQMGVNDKTITDKIAALVPDYAAIVQKNNKNLSAGQARFIAECVLAYSSQYGVDARLVMALIKNESGFDPMSTSSAGAQGLGQLMPETSRSLGIADPYDIEANIYGTVRTLRGHLDREGADAGSTYQQLSLALAAYNAGSGAVKKYGGVPPYPDTMAYVQRVIATYRKLAGV